ncbi:glycoside hydrolase family 76 protein [Coniochaeta sp. 2T2.1]|nr:glycoside hydrolase family 76 protein [Coniochaeta sp. 2T2.1]
MKSATVSALVWATAASAITVKPSDANSIKDAAKSVAKNLVSYYHGAEPGKTPGILPGPPPDGDFYWWESGAMWNTLIEYWHYTGDSTYNDLVTQGTLWQVGPANAYMPYNQTAMLGNDDQGFWGMAAMTAAETGLTNPSTKPDTQWLALAENVFATFAHPLRWNDKDSCGGGLRWQIVPANIGYDYKNSGSTGAMFNLAARLARHTNNATYAAWAEKTWAWMESVGYLDQGDIYDGAHVRTNCTDINRIQFSYIAGIFAQGAAYMYNHTNGSAVWEGRLATLVNATSLAFFDDSGNGTGTGTGIAIERSCEGYGNCSIDMLAMKGILLRGLASVVKLAPFTRGQVAPLLGATAVGAGAACDAEGRCGFEWGAGVSGANETYGAGQQMNALSALSVLLVDDAAAPPTNGVAHGGSGGDGGIGSQTPTTGAPTGKPTNADKSGAGMTADRAGAGFMVATSVLTVVFAALLA